MVLLLLGSRPHDAIVRQRGDYNYKNEDMLMGALTVSQSFKTYITELGYVNTKWTPEYAIGLRNRIEGAINAYLGEPYRQELRDATLYLQGIQAKSIKWLQVIKTQIEVYFENSDKILTELGYTQYWNSAYQSKDQESQISLHKVFERNIVKHKVAFVEVGISPAILDEIRVLGKQMLEGNLRQEELKSSTVEEKSDAIERFNEIYNEVIGICKIAQRFFKDNPELKDRFVFDNVINRANNRANNRVTAEAETEESVVTE